MATSGSSSSPSSPSSPKRQRVAPPPPPPPPRRTDMLMALPPDILDDRILVLLPFHKLVRTSCLSRAWRRRWESVRNLEIELPRAYSGGGRALWRCARPVRFFSARVARRDVFRAARWLRALARKGVQDLSLEFSLAGKQRPLPGPALFSCAALVQLDLEQCDMPAAPPGFLGFPNLERLDLVYVTLPFAGAGTQLEHLIVAAEKLAVLNLSPVITINGGGVDTWAIRAPKLRKLYITMEMGDDNGCRIPMPLPMLEEVTISFDRLFGTQDFLDAFQNISTVNKLFFKSDKFNINMLEGITCKFENLREGGLIIDLGQRSSVLSLVSLLKFAPHIEHLYIRTDHSILDPVSSEDEMDEDSLNSEDEFDEDSLNSQDEIDEDSLNSEISSDLLASLKYVTLINMNYESNGRYGNACRELTECQKASPQVVLTAKRVAAEAPPPPPPPATTGTRTDMLMALPSDILNDRILVLLPFDKLVRTSCLSRAWRRRWESVANLRIEFPASVSSSRALWRCAAPIRGFRARVATRNVYRAARWLRAMASRLTICRAFPDPPSSPAPNFVSLRLEKCDMPAAPPGFPGFPNLERLYLVGVTLPYARAGTQLEHLILASENLAVLELSNLGTMDGAVVVDPWAIRAPNLRELSVTMPMGVDFGCRITEALPKLEDAYISFDCVFGTQEFLDAFQNISTVNKLCFMVAEFSINMLEGITCKFENLREASLNIDFGQFSSVLSIDSLLKFAPHIEHLEIQTLDTELDKEKIDEDSLNSEISSDLFASLKHVSLTGAKHRENQMCFMKFLLSKAGSLQTFAVTFMFDDDGKSEWFENKCKELIECQKASPQLLLTAKVTQDGSCQGAILDQLTGHLKGGRADVAPHGRPRHHPRADPLRPAGPHVLPLPRVAAPVGVRALPRHPPRLGLPRRALRRDLWRCAAPVVGFRACVHARHFHHLPTWFPALASKGVRELAIECDGVRRGHPDTPPYWVIDQGLFSCAALAVLHLEDCDMPLAPPGFRGFPSLVSLTLRGVTLPAEGGGARVEHLVAAAPLLAELRLDDVDVEELEDPTPPLYMWAVRAPRLRVLKMATRLDIGCRIPHCWRRRTSTLFNEYPLEGISCKFDNLREAEDISFSHRDDPYEIEEDDFISSGINENSFSSLKYVSLSGITYSSNQLCFMKFLLSKTESLQSFAVTFLYSKSNKEYGTKSLYVKACRVLRAFRRASASPQARFEVRLWDKPTPRPSFFSCLPP
uniref:F-box/LRR-repeat protein 15/At3g58940/PEG3-like LRR domain-containing protein n=1 Tax=Oryza nivara TaxID=4536 RepID=A0A0E0I9G5_ORYNI